MISTLVEWLDTEREEGKSIGKQKKTSKMNKASDFLKPSPKGTMVVNCTFFLFKI